MVFEKVLSTINKYNLIESGDKIVIGISGGPILFVYCTY